MAGKASLHGWSRWPLSHPTWSSKMERGAASGTITETANSACSTWPRTSPWKSGSQRYFQDYNQNNTIDNGEIISDFWLLSMLTCLSLSWELVLTTYLNSVQMFRFRWEMFSEKCLRVKHGSNSESLQPCIWVSFLLLPAREDVYLVRWGCDSLPQRSSGTGYEVCTASPSSGSGYDVCTASHSELADRPEVRVHRPRTMPDRSAHPAWGCRRGNVTDCLYFPA